MKRSIITKLKTHFVDIIAGSTGCGIGVTAAHDMISGMNMTYKELRLLFLITTGVGLIFFSIGHVISDSTANK